MAGFLSYTEPPHLRLFCVIDRGLAISVGPRLPWAFVTVQQPPLSNLPFTIIYAFLGENFIKPKLVVSHECLT